MEALPRGQSVYETSAIPRVTSGLPHGAVLDAWLDSLTKQPHASMQQSIAVAGVEERDVCGTRQPNALGPVTALPGASNILPVCVRSAVTVIRPVTALPIRAAPQVVGHAPQHSQNTMFSCSGVASGDFYALDPDGRQIIDTATSAGALRYLTALPPSSGLPLSSASGVDATPSSLSLSHSASLSLLGGVGMSQSGVASPVLSGAPDPLGTPPPLA